MKNTRFRNYIYWGVTAMAVIACSVALIFFISRFGAVKGAAKTLVGILMPVIYGAVLAYLLLPVYNRSRTFFENLMEGAARSAKDSQTGVEEEEESASRSSNKRAVRSIAKAGATLVSLALLFVVVAGLFSMIIPQIYDSVVRLRDSMGENINNLALWLQKVLADNPEVESAVIPLYEQLAQQLQAWLSDSLVPNMDTVINMTAVINRISTGLLGVAVVLKNLLIGIIVMVYLLNIKESLAAQGKKIIYSILDIKNANQFIEEIRSVHGIFGGFITGKLLDSLIIGILSFFIFSIAKMPYVLLVSVIIGVTNVIPFFGPFIGAIPSGFLILLVSPAKCLLFVFLIIGIQQFDGNILGPKILGQSTGLPSFWVLFSILLCGGLFGFVGMIIAVPAFAVAYSAIKRLVNRSLKKKELSLNTGDYGDLKCIDEDKTYIKIKEEA